MNDSYVLEVALFTVKPEHVKHLPTLRAQLRETLKDFPGLISYEAYAPIGENTFADIAKWQSHEHAQAAAQAFAEGDPRFLPYMQAIESLSFMGHFVPGDAPAA